MPRVRPTSKQVLTLVAVTLLLVLAAIIFATAAQGAARFLTTPIGYAPPATAQPQWRIVHVEPIKYVKPTPRPTARPRAAPAAAVKGRCYAEPGTPPHSVMWRESKGNPSVYNYQGSGASGCWQFMPGTWGGYKGYANAADAPVAVQNERAKQVWAGGAGCGHWASC